MWTARPCGLSTNIVCHENSMSKIIMSKCSQKLILYSTKNYKKRWKVAHLNLDPSLIAKKKSVKDKIYHIHVYISTFITVIVLCYTYLQ